MPNGYVSPGALSYVHKQWGFLYKANPRVFPDPPVLAEYQLKEIAEVLGVTHQRIAQLQREAIRKLMTKAEHKLGYRPTCMDDLVEAFRHGPL